MLCWTGPQLLPCSSYSWHTNPAMKAANSTMSKGEIHNYIQHTDQQCVNLSSVSLKQPGTLLANMTGLQDLKHHNHVSCSCDVMGHKWPHNILGQYLRTYLLNGHGLVAHNKPAHDDMFQQHELKLRQQWMGIKHYKHSHYLLKLTSIMYKKLLCL